MASHGARRVVTAALVGNVLVTATKLVAALVTGSSAMLSESVHTAADTGNELLLLHGLRRAARPPDADHPFGHGRELRAAKGSLGYLEAVRQSKDPATFIILAEDTGAILGILIAFSGTVAAVALRRPVLDGAASIAIGVLLGAIALILARETKGLLIGEPARSELVSSICRMAREHGGVERSNGLFTVHMGPRQVVAALSVEFQDSLTAGQVESIVADLETRVRARHPEVVSVLVKPQRADAADFRLAPDEDER